MAHKDSRGLSMVLPYLYPNLKNNGTHTGDYRLQSDGDDTGTFLVWQNNEISEPTEQELADAKEAAVNAWWWKRLREKRDRFLRDSDWTQGIDVPSAIKNAWATHRQELRDLPTTVTKPSFETLNNLMDIEWNIKSFMPTKPAE